MMETYNGYVRTPQDAIKLFEACRLGILPRVQRRLSEKERQSIRSGSVFVWDEQEAGMRRWTDGKSWSASRVSGSFLTYREMEGKRGTGFGNTRRATGRSPEGGRQSDDDQETEPEGYRYKADGLLKQSFSMITSQGHHLHLISYFSRPQSGGQDLLLPTSDPALRNVQPSKGMYPESSVHEPSPAMTRAPMASYGNYAGSPPQDQSAYAQHWVYPAWMGTECTTTTWPPPPSPNHAPPWAMAPDYAVPNPYNTLQPVLPHRPPPNPMLPASGPTSHSPIYDRFPSRPAPYLTNRNPSLSPHAHHLQLQAAHAVMTSPHNPQGPLPAIAPPGRGATTPPRTGHLSAPGPSGTVRRASLSSMLRYEDAGPHAAGPEPNGVKPTHSDSAGGSPQAHGASACDSMDRMPTDEGAIQALNRGFRI